MKEELFNGYKLPLNDYLLPATI